MEAIYSLEEFPGWKITSDIYLVNWGNPSTSPYSKGAPLCQKYSSNGHTTSLKHLIKRGEEQEKLFYELLKMSQDMASASKARKMIKTHYDAVKERLQTNSTLSSDRCRDLLYDIGWAYHAVSRWIDLYML